MPKVNFPTVQRSLLLILALTLALFAYEAATPRSSATIRASGHPMVITTVLDVNCPSDVSFGEAYVKIDDIGGFTVHSSDSVVEVTFNGRLYVGSLELVAYGATFELRVDDLPTPNGRARMAMRDTETAGDGIQASITGIFTGLSPGTHTVNMWVEGFNGGGEGAQYDPGCWDADHVVIKEYVPLGASLVPLVVK